MIAGLQLRTGMTVIAESLHLHNYKFLWDLLFERHPQGAYYRGAWEKHGESKTEVPSYALILEMLEKQPTALILDEFQTWYEGLTNTKQYPWRTWAFNFIQILSEIAEKHPELLMLVVSVRDGNSDAAQQVYRVNPIRIDFKGPQAKKDRRRLLLYRLFENRLQIPRSDIESVIATHFEEFLRLHHVPGPDHDRYRDEFVDAWPFSPLLLQLLDDQVLIAVDAQEARDLIRILVDVFKAVRAKKVESPVITAADFSITNEKSGVASLLDSVASQLHRDLREKAQRNLDAVEEALHGGEQEPPEHLEEILSALWLRSLSMEKMAGAEPHELHLDITRGVAIDDNQFQVELDLIEQNSFNIHPKGNRLVFLNEENPQAKLMANAQNDKLFENGEDVDHLADEIRYVLAGNESSSQSFRVLVLRKNWSRDPWAEVDEKDHPDKWDARIPVVVIPSATASDADLGRWLKSHVAQRRNTVRFLLPKRDTSDIFRDRALLVLARAVHLAAQWKSSDPVYSPLHVKYQRELRSQLRSRFDRFAVLETWNFAAPDKCTFSVEAHEAEGEHILNAVQDKIRQELFIPEEFEDLALAAVKDNRSAAQVLEQVREPRPNGEPSIPWLGETEIKEQIVLLCAHGRIAINLGREWLQSKPGEPSDVAWNRMKGRLPSGRQLEGVTLSEPGSAVTSGGGQTTTGTGTGTEPGRRIGHGIGHHYDNWWRYRRCDG